MRKQMLGALFLATIPVFFSAPLSAKTVTAEAICKCVGDNECGGGKIHKFDFTTQADCKNSQKDADDLCNSNREKLCNDKKVGDKTYSCRFRHTDKKCPK